MNGTICVVTGATQGIGRETARALAALGAQVWLHGRDLGRARAVAADITCTTGNAHVHAVQADFACLAQVRRLAGELAQLPRLDVLVNNAGLMRSRPLLSADGYDMTFAVNHLAPFLLTNLLLDQLHASGPARIVIVSSEAHRRGRLDFDDLMNTRARGMWRAYSRSKLANLLFMRLLAQRLSGTAVTANALHPGVVRTQLFNDSALMRILLGSAARLFLRSPAQGARGSIYLASSRQLVGRSGGYYRDCRLTQPSRAARSDTDAARLWQLSAHLTGLPA